MNAILFERTKTSIIYGRKGKTARKAKCNFFFSLKKYFEKKKKRKKSWRTLEGSRNKPGGKLHQSERKWGGAKQLGRKSLRIQGRYEVQRTR